MSLKKTISSIFLVPTLKLNREKLEKCGYLNGYIRDVNRDMNYGENTISLLFHPPNKELFQEFVDAEYLKSGSDLIDDYDLGDGYVVMVYNLNRRFKEDFKLIKQGKYSKTSKEFQELFPKVTKIVSKLGLQRDEISLSHKIFNKAEDLREYWENKIAVNFKEDMEIWDTWVEENELLEIDKIKELCN